MNKFLEIFRVGKSWISSQIKGYKAGSAGEEFKPLRRCVPHRTLGAGGGDKFSPQPGVEHGSFEPGHSLAACLTGLRLQPADDLRAIGGGRNGASVGEVGANCVVQRDNVTV